MKNSSIASNSEGFSMLEVLVGIVFISMMGYSILLASIVSVRYQKYAEIGNVAMNLAMSKAEELSGVNINTLDNSYDESEYDLTSEDHKIKFNRVTDVTVNPDGSRTIDVTVSSSAAYLPKPIRFNTTLAPWES